MKDTLAMAILSCSIHLSHLLEIVLSPSMRDTLWTLVRRKQWSNNIWRDAISNPLKIGSNPYFHWGWCATGTWGLLCNDVEREGAKPSPELVSELFCYMPLHNIEYGIRLTSIIGTQLNI